MDAATTSYTTPPGSVDAPHRGRDDSLPQSPDRLPVSVVAQWRSMKAGAVCSPVRRSPRLSCLSPPQPPMGCQDTGSDHESESIDGVAVHFSREETPENDPFPPDEPSTVLANRILRAHDNPSPPPQDVAHPGVDHVPGKNGQLPSLGVSAPPSPFRPINLLERLNQLSDPPFDPSRSLSTPASGDRLDVLEPSILPPRGFISPESCSPPFASLPMKSSPHKDLASAGTFPSSSTQYTVNDLPSRSSQHGQLVTTTSSIDAEASGSSVTQAVDSSLNPVVPPASDVCSRESLPSSGRQSYRNTSPIASNAMTISSPPLNKDGKASLATEATVAGGQDDSGKEFLSMTHNDLSVLKERRESKYTKEVDAILHQRLDSLSPHSTNVLSGSIEQTKFPAEPTCTKHSPETTPQTPRPPVIRPEVSRSTVQRPVVAPTPVRANNDARKLFSPAKFSSEANDTCRTPAQRVPIETAFARETSSFQKTLQLSTGSDPSQLGRFPTIRALVFTRPALDDPSRSPAKRILVTDLATSPSRGEDVQSSPTRFGLRARSASVEPRPLRSILPRCRSVEHCPTFSKLDSHERLKESVFPMVPMPPRSGTRLPFPLVPGQKSNSDLPPPIPEEHETTETGSTETDATPGRPTQGTMPQLRQPPVNSRIPRIGNKPYARPAKNGKATAATATVHTTRAPKTPPFQLARKNGRVRNNNNMEVHSTQPTNNVLSIGSLKRKRGAEAATSSHSVMIRQVVPGILSEKYAPKLAKIPSQVQPLPESSPPKVTQPLKFRKVVDGMLSARYAPAMANLAQTELSDSTLPPPSPLSELSSSSGEGPSDGKPATVHPPARSSSETPDPSRNDDAFVVEPGTCDHSSSHQDAHDGEPNSHPRRTSRTRKPAQQQYVLDVFNGNTSTRPPPGRRKPQSRTEGDGFMGMSATALKALTTSNTTRNQQTVAVLATEVIRKEGLRPESPTVKARTILQKQRDERDIRRRERAQRRAQMSENGLGISDTEGPDHGVSLSRRADRDENDYAMPQKHCQGPGEEEDYETPERPERIIEPPRLEGTDRKVKPAKQVKWHRGLSTAVYLDEVDPRPKPLAKSVVVRGCLAPTSKNMPLDSLGNLVDIDNQPFPELITEQIIVKRYLYDNDTEPEPIPEKMTRSKSKKSRS